MDYPQAVVSILVFSVCALVGVPVWWNTTKVYRAQLPRQQIISVQSMPVKLNLKVDILFRDEAVMDDNEELLNVLSSNNLMSAGIYQLEFNFSVSSVSISGDDPKHHCKELESFQTRTEMLQYRIIISRDPSSSELLRYYCDNALDTIFVTNNLNGTILGNEIISLMKLYTNIEELSSMFHSQKVFEVSKPSLSMPPAIGYKVVLTLAVANPSDYMPSWNVQEAIDQYLNPLLSKIDFLGPIQVSSQILYFVDFKEKPKRKGKNFYYQKEKLALLMNEIQPRLNTYTSTDATLNFIVYIPPAKFVPLHIKSEKKDLSGYNAFHSARWGGLQIFNPPNTTENSKQVKVPVDVFMKTIILQFSELFGMSLSKYVDVFPDNQMVGNKWMLTKLLITKNYEYLSKCLSTLTSLYKLLGEIENIVISQEIRYLIENALKNYELSVNYLAKGFVNEAIKYSKNAFEFSEKAFYDASLLALLYFPDDQKYAIYIPLFLPAAFPVLSSVYRTFRWWKSTGTLSC